MISGRKAQGNRLGRELFHHPREVVPCESPIEGCGHLLVILLEAQQSVLDFRQAGEIIGGQRLALDDGEVDLNLVEPTGMDWAVNRNEIGKGLGQALHAWLPTMRRAVIHDPEHAACIAVGRLSHHLGNKATERFDTAGLLTTTEDFGTVYVERSQIGPCPTTLILMFDPGGAMRAWGQGGMRAYTRLNACLFIGREDKFIRVQASALPLPRVEVQNALSLELKLGVAREDPGAVLPWADRIFVQPAPYGAAADARHDAASLGFAHDISAAEARQWHAPHSGQLTGEALDLHDQLRGEKPEAGPGAGVRPSLLVVRERSACAIGSLHRDRTRARLRSRRWRVPRLQGESSWHAEPRSTATYTCERGFPEHRARVVIRRIVKGLVLGIVDAPPWRHNSAEGQEVATIIRSHIY
jgi:hypothetical protein